MKPHEAIGRVRRYRRQSDQHRQSDGELDEQSTAEAVFHLQPLRDHPRKGFFVLFRPQKAVADVELPKTDFCGGK